MAKEKKAEQESEGTAGELFGEAANFHKPGKCIYTVNSRPCDIHVHVHVQMYNRDVHVHVRAPCIFVCVCTCNVHLAEGLV